MTNTIIAWTDGSSKAINTDSPYGGWGVYLELGDKAFELYGGQDLTTNNRMEMTAVIKALEKINVKGGNNVEIRSDSALIINCINDGWYIKWKNNGWKNSKKQDIGNKGLWERMLELVKLYNNNGLTVTFTKVKGHSGIYGNEKADELANMGAKIIKEQRLENQRL